MLKNFYVDHTFSNRYTLDSSLKQEQYIKILSNGICHDGEVEYST